jgi:23S rRNA pseudouridine1911/1915/1917 synthase
MTLDILYEDNHCLAVNKPAGRLSQADASGANCLVDDVERYLKTRYQKPGNVYVGLLHRLDQPTSGVVLVAKTSKAAARLSEQFRSGRIAKIYDAIVEGVPVQREGVWTDRLAKDHADNRSTVASGADGPGKEARVAYRVVESCGRFSKLELRPETGRSHQLRVQLSERQMPIAGDRKYGAKSRIMAADGLPRIALHARAIRFEHPTRREELWVEAPLPEDWPRSWPR